MRSDCYDACDEICARKERIKTQAKFGHLYEVAS